MEVPAHIAEGLRNIRSGLHLRFNSIAVKKAAGFDAWGKAKDVTVEPRFELWDTDPQGQEYMVMRVQDQDGQFRFPTESLVEHINKLNPARYGGSVEKLVRAQMEDPELLREIGNRKDSDDLIDAVVKWAEWTALPKSGAALSYRGRRLLS